MYKKNITHHITVIIACISLWAMSAGCLKSSDSLIRPSGSMESDKEHLLKILEKADSLSLFYQALQQTGYADMLATNRNFTLLVPGNKAMLAAGLSAAKMKQLPPDSLRKIVAGHMLPGAYDNNALEGLQITAFMPSMRMDTVLIPQQQFVINQAYLSIQKADQLYVNNDAVATNTPPVAAANGFIYPIGKVISFAPIDESKTLWDVIQTDPDLRMYRDAILLLDSIKKTDVYFDGTIFYDILSPPLDEDLLSARKTNPANGTINNRNIPVVFAPTNQAFYDAGFHTIDDLRRFAYRYPFGVESWANEDYTEVMFTYHFSSLDTLLAHNILTNGIGDGADRYPPRILYPDMLKGKINNGTFNKMTRLTAYSVSTYVKYPEDLQFSAANGIAYVQDRRQAAKIMIPKDTDPLKPVNNYNLDNGVLYKVGKLFYPFN
ncbi:fasciclin domain-containing protein [Chitinophaga nivalis]|uniref:Fasciclin domain-containing protein n=1 Tax=Chitinophaga nivalis TaxID=2991709 RepID=A0ABT3IKF0_9BACT|nr:fasciclin domain-containing protein [Chitinophaga nivalis]MCW3466070.1 fasciclin domain-containing protein [Chitinophaga nivalis]MCW3484239.1 fasciclin domain-containing protein [Chitinophaga nivalis]